MDSFKINLEKFKVNNIANTNGRNFWDVSDEALSKIEGKGYLENKVKHNEFLEENKFVAKKIC